jgi:hypothetical protein
LGVQGSVKTAYARFAARQVQQQGRLVWYFSAGDIPHEMKNIHGNSSDMVGREDVIPPDVFKALRKLLPLRPVEYKESAMVPPPVSIIINQLEDHLKDLEDTHSFCDGGIKLI